MNHYFICQLEEKRRQRTNTHAVSAADLAGLGSVTGTQDSGFTSQTPKPGFHLQPIIYFEICKCVSREKCEVIDTDQTG